MKVDQLVKRVTREMERFKMRGLNCFQKIYDFWKLMCNSFQVKLNGERLFIQVTPNYFGTKVLFVVLSL